MLALLPEGFGILRIEGEGANSSHNGVDCHIVGNDGAECGPLLATSTRSQNSRRQFQRLQNAIASPGEDCFIVKMYVKEISSLNRVLDQFLVRGQTTTSIVQSSLVPLRGLPLPDTR